MEEGCHGLDSLAALVVRVGRPWCWQGPEGLMVVALSLLCREL